MAILNNQGDDFEKAFEQGLATAKNVTKQAVKTVAQDIKEQIVGSKSNSNRDERVSGLPAEKKQTVEDERMKQLELTRQNLDQLNKKIQEIREKRKQKERETQRLAQGEKQKKIFKEEKKKESIEQINLKKSSAREILKGVSG